MDAKEARLIVQQKFAESQYYADKALAVWRPLSQLVNNKAADVRPKLRDYEVLMLWEQARDVFFIALATQPADKDNRSAINSAAYECRRWIYAKFDELDKNTAEHKEAERAKRAERRASKKKG